MKKQFHLGDILSVTTGKLVSPTGMTGLVALLDFMTRDSNFTHQLPRVADECRPWLLRQHPQLAKINDCGGSYCTPHNHRRWLAYRVQIFGEFHDVEPIPQDDHERKCPYDELVEMRGSDEGIIIISKDKE